MTRLASTILFVALTATTACKGKTVTETAPPEMAAMAVPLTTVAAQATPSLITLSGTVEAHETSDVAADTAGKVVAVLVDDGDRVKKGDPLLRLDTRNASLSSREVKANVESARIQQTLANEERARAEALLAKGAITQSEFDRANASATSAAQQVIAIQARQSMVGKQVSDGVVRAPFDGIVTRKAIAVGEWVAPGTPLLAVVDDDPMLVALSVPESEVLQISMGQVVTVNAVAYADKSFAAKVTRVGTEIGKMTRSLRVEAELLPGSGLRPGMFVMASINVGNLPLPVLPATAVAKRGQTWRAFVAVNGHLEERVVQLGAAPGAGLVSVAKGVAVGDKVATTVTEQIVDGVRLQ